MSCNRGKLSIVILAVAGHVLATASSVNAAPLYWDNGVGVSPGVYGTAANWDTAAGGGGGDPGRPPGATDIASFNVSTLSATQLLSLQANVAVQGLDFTSTGNVTLQSNSNSRTLTIGTDGITKSGTTGVSAVGLPANTSGLRLIVNLGATQTWSNNASTGTLSVISGGTGIIQLTNAGAQTLTLTGSNTAQNSVASTLANGSGTLSVVKDGAGTWAYTGGASATYSGGLTINSGIFSHGFTTNASGLGTGTLTLNGGELRGGVSNMTVANAINVTANSTISPTRLDLTNGLTIVAFNGAFTSSGTLGNGPVLTIDQHNLTSPPTTTLGGAATGSWSGFNGTLKINQSVTNTGTTQFTGTTAAGSDLSNGKLMLTTPSNSPVGVNRVDFLSNTAGVNLFRVGELSGTGFLAYRGQTGVSSTIEIGNVNTNSTFSGDIRHFQDTSVITTLGLNKIGTGSLTLSGNNDYSGGTKISNGALIAGVDAGIAKFLPTDQLSENIKVDATTDIFTAQDALNAPMNHGFVDGDRVSIFRQLAAADYGLTNKNLYVKTISPSTFELYTDPALTTKVDVNTSVANFLRISMPSSLGSETASSTNRVIQLGTGTDSNSVSLLAGASDANLSVTIARDINVAANTGGTSTIGSTVNGNSVFSGAIALGKNAELTSVSAGANTLTVSGVVSSTGTFGLTKVGVGNATLSNVNTYSGNTTVNDGTLNVTGSLANNNFDKVFIAAPDSTLAGNAILNRSIAASASYTGFGSTEVGGLGSTVELLAGTASAATTLGMQWRLRTDTEKGFSEGGTPSSPPLAQIGTNGLVSEVVDLNGLGSDLYVLQMSYDETKLINPEAVLAATQALYLGSFNTGTGLWENSIVANTGNNASQDQHGFAGSFSSFQTAYGTTLTNYIGAFGVDTTNNLAWAVVNHNSQFGVVPEPSSFALLLFGSIAAASARKKRSM